MGACLDKCVSVCACVCIHTHVEVRGQYWVSPPTPHRVSLSFLFKEFFNILLIYFVFLCGEVCMNAAAQVWSSKDNCRHHLFPSFMQA